VRLKKTPQGHELARELGKSLKTKFGTLKKATSKGKPQKTQADQTLVAFFRVGLDTSKDH